ncbi:MAG: exopolysaccharide biosynthesis protein [Elusimicrobia bacterium]|nr:exopolysaccharide biosynthesis protein [Elusimicrobiota bacterium]
MTEPGAARQARLSTELDRLSAACRESSLTVGKLLPGLAPRDQALFTAILSVGFLHPIPLPGVSTVFGLVIASAGCRMALGLGPWIPQRWHNRHIPGHQMARVFAAGAALMRRCERVVKPRGLWLSAHPWTQRASGCAIAFCGLLLGAPLPPGTNFPPATAILLLSIGTAEEDLLFLAAGYLALAFNILFFGAILVLGWDGVKALLR